MFRRGVTTQDNVLVLKQLALLLKAGVALVSGITSLRNQAMHPVMAAAFGEMEKRLRSGETFTAALTAAMPSLPSYVFQLAAAGEAIGHLGEALDDAATQMAYEQRIRQDVRNALTYPTVLVTVGISAVLFIFIVVVPRFAGMVASATPLPVIGVPVPLARLDGMDSLLSIVQMPAGVPVATVSIGGARNAGLLAVRILGSADAELRARMVKFQADLEAMVLAKDAALRDRLLGDA